MKNNGQDTIYDVGLFDGEDTAYYLSRGYRVIAIDANPIMVERATRRFAKEIEEKRLTLLNRGISENRGSAIFWVSDNPEWSSFDKNIASRSGTPHRAVTIPTCPFSDIVAEYGIPHYLKIDIEGNDKLCVSALSARWLPPYISMESECVGDSQTLDDEQAVATLNLLRDRGYTRFKLVNQAGWNPVRPGRFSGLRMRILESVARGRLRFPGLSRLAQKFTDAGKLAALGYKFQTGSSGPWGEDVPGPWMSFSEAREACLRERRSAFSGGRELYSFWYDWHATYDFEVVAEARERNTVFSSALN